MKNYKSLFLLSLIISYCLLLNGCATTSSPFAYSSSPLNIEEQSLLNKSVWNMGGVILFKECPTYDISTGTPQLTSKEGSSVVFNPLTEFKIVNVQKKNLPADPVYRFIRFDVYFVTFQDTTGNIYMYAGFYSGGIIELLKRSFIFENPYNLHPEWSKEAWNLIRQGKIWIGATKEQITYSAGDSFKPIKKETDTSGVSEIWSIGNKKLYFKNDGLAKWEDNAIEQPSSLHIEINE